MYIIPVYLCTIICFYNFIILPISLSYFSYFSFFYFYVMFLHVLSPLFCSSPFSGNFLLFLDALLSEVTHTHHGFPDALPNHSKDVINFTKWRKLGRHLLSISVIQNTPYTFMPVEVRNSVKCFSEKLNCLTYRWEQFCYYFHIHIKTLCFVADSE